MSGLEFYCTNSIIAVTQLKSGRSALIPGLCAALAWTLGLSILH